MEARDAAERIKDAIDEGLSLGADLDILETTWGYGDADFFVDVEGEGRFLVSVVKVAE